MLHQGARPWARRISNVLAANKSIVVHSYLLWPQGRYGTLRNKGNDGGTVLERRDVFDDTQGGYDQGLGIGKLSQAKLCR